MDQLRALKVFIAVVDHGGFAAAARALDLAPAGVTRLVSDLEQSLGARLLHRTTRKLTLTAVGAQYLERARQIVLDLEEANALAAETVSQVRGSLRLAGPAPLLAQLIVPLLPAFRARYPGVELFLCGAPHTQAPEDHADLTLLAVGQRPLDGDFVARQLAVAEIVLCATPAYLDQHGRPTEPMDLLAHEVLVPSFANVAEGWTLRRRDAERHPGPPSVHVPCKPCSVGSDSVDVLLAAARAGLGIAATLSFQVQEDLRKGQLERVLCDWNLGQYMLYVAMPTRKYLPMRTKAFIDFLLESFGGESRDPWLPAQGA
ncbi:LysR substrate-binding domain-containing protein [Inhella sp.]|uniref:LysR family transcriptional regulator n=1 Tax=Inhella sp. TaxID=1921806 RepID=UPI0035B3736D